MNINRRTFLTATGYIVESLLVSSEAQAQHGASDADWKAAARIANKREWSETDLFLFVQSLPNDARHSLLLAMGAQPGADATADAEAAIRQFKWACSSWITYPFKDNRTVDYEAVLRWVAGKRGLPTAGVSMLDLERQIFKSEFEILWDKMTPSQRVAVVDTVNKQQGLRLNALKLSLMSGTAAYVAFIGAVGAYGFTFYTTMSVVICAIAAAFGVTLPFVVYTTAATTVAVLSGPVGWGILAGLATTTIGVIGMASASQTSRFVLAIHGARMASIEQARSAFWPVFGATASAAVAVAGIMWWIRTRKQALSTLITPVQDGPT